EALAALQKFFRTAYLDRVDPAPNLAGIYEPITTMHYDYTIFGNSDVPAERIKQILALIVDQKQALGQNQPLFQDMRTERMYKQIDVPYHEGAVAFFRERGISAIK